MSTEYVMVEFYKDWADEFSVEGAHFTSKELWEEEQRILDRYADSEVYYYFGSNEGWEDELLNEFEYTVNELSEDAYFELDRMGFPQRIIGLFAFPSELVEHELDEKN